MNLITTSHEIKNELTNPGYSVVPSDEIHISKNLNEAKKAFFNDWNHLIVDEHMNDGGKYRLRRYGRYSLNSETMDLNYQGEVEYFQTKGLNPLNGGEVRQFAPITKESVENQFLQELILFDYNQLPIKPDLTTTKWNVGVHQIRILAEPGKQGQPAPEGIHKDGEMYTVQHLIDRNNIEGGQNAAYDNNKNLIATWMQSKKFDSYYFEDDAIYHSVSEITSKDESCMGYRDVLLIDFDPIKD
ncbi:MAG: 2OG-Fe dioxygenase family protein [Candidatus Heimdallarchaeota archaeon]|nr:2OG-Fe dioxygenase family protein [Candidatus Heimdallarchaeota archaeon]